MHNSVKIGLLAVFIPFALSATSYTFNSASGNVNVTTNWTPNGTPGIGDTVDIPTGKHAICPNGFTWHVGTHPTSFSAGSPDISIDSDTSADGVLELQSGCIFEPSGFILLNNTGTGGANCRSATPLIPKLLADTGSTWNWDENNGTQAYWVYTGGNSGCWTQLQIGTSGDQCGALAASCPTHVNCINCASVDPILFNPPATGWDTNFTRIYGSDLQNCGSSTVACWVDQTLGNPDGCSSCVGNMIATGNIFTAIGFANPFGDENYDASTLQMNFNNKFLNTLSTTIFGSASGNGATLSNPCNFGGYFDKQVGGNGISFYCTFANIVAPSGFFMSSINPGASGSFHNILSLAGSDLFSLTGITNDYVFAVCQPVCSGSTHMIDIGSNGGVAGSMTLDHIIGENLGSSAGESHLFEVQGVGTNTTGTGATITNVLSLPAPLTGANSGNLWAIGDCGSAWRQWPVQMRHNTMLGTAPLTWGAFPGGHDTTCWPNNLTITDYRSNLQWASSAAGSGYPYFPISTAFISGNASSAPAGIIDSTKVDYNVIFNGGVGFSYPAAFDINCPLGSTTQGTPEDYCATDAIPDTHSIISQNPRFVDSKRDIRSWSVTQGQASSWAGANTVFANAALSNYSTLFANLFWYTFTGSTATNLAIYKKGHDGATAGASEMSPQYWNDIR